MMAVPDTSRRLRIEIFGVGIPLIVVMSSFLGYRMTIESSGARGVAIASLVAGLGIFGIAVLLQRRGGNRPLRAGGWVFVAALLGASQVATSTRTGQSASIAFFDGILIALLVRSVLLGHFMHAVRGRKPD